MGTEIVTIQVGPKRKSFIVHKKLICDRSDYFSKAFNGNFWEREGVIYFPEEDFATFESFITYLYQDRLPQFFPTQRADKHSFEHKKLYPLFFLAEKLCINELANRVMDAIQDFGFQLLLTPSRQNIIQVYNNTHQASKLRIYCVLTEAYYQNSAGDNEEDLANLTAISRSVPEFASDYMILQWKYHTCFRNQNATDPQLRDDQKGFGRCYFHTHAKGEVCHLQATDPKSV
jgi:hypothetical protein